jgi:DHA1 family multidrug resistance protein-like MFS transporter
VFINYVIDSYDIHAAPAVAANVVLRSAYAACPPLFTDYIFDTLGVAVLLLPIPFVFYRYGAVLRGRSKYATTDNWLDPDDNKLDGRCDKVV